MKGLMICAAKLPRKELATAEVCACTVCINTIKFTAELW